MRAVGFYRFGGPEVLEVVELPLPEPTEGQVRIRVAAATVNPTDLGLRAGARAAQLEKIEPPYVPGMELAGVVDAAPGSSWTEGAEVMAVTTPMKTGRGAQSEYCVVPAASVAAVPAGCDFAAAATVPMNGLTVRRGFDLLAADPGSSLVVTGAAGAVGGYAVQFGAAAGLEVVAVASPADEEFVRSIGATHFVARGDGLAERVRDTVGGPVDTAFDAALVGPPLLAAIRDGGALAAVRPFAGESERGISIHQISVSDYLENTAALDDLRSRVEAGRLTLRVAETFPPERAAEAHERLAAGGVRGGSSSPFDTPSDLSRRAGRLGEPGRHDDEREW